MIIEEDHPSPVALQQGLAECGLTAECSDLEAARAGSQFFDSVLWTHEENLEKAGVQMLDGQSVQELQMGLGPRAKPCQHRDQGRLWPVDWYRALVGRWKGSENLVGGLRKSEQRLCGFGGRVGALGKERYRNLDLGGHLPPYAGIACFGIENKKPRARSLKVGKDCLGPLVTGGEPS
jgi:hypothetical protein